MKPKPTTHCEFKQSDHITDLPISHRCVPINTHENEAVDLTLRMKHQSKKLEIKIKLDQGGYINGCSEVI